MTLAILYATTFIVFLAVDYVGLSYLIKPTFEKDIAPLLLDKPRLAPAGLFYAFYVGCLLWFVSWPAMEQDRTILWVIGNAALIGAVGYGTYEFTNIATLKDWTWRMLATDLTWGVALTATSAAVGVAVTRAVSP